MDDNFLFAEKEAPGFRTDNCFKQVLYSDTVNALEKEIVRYLEF